MTYKIEIKPANITFSSDSNLLDDALSQSIHLEHSCQTGECGICVAEVLDGTITNEIGEDVSQGKVLLCKSKAKANSTLLANYYAELSGITQQTLPCKVSSIKLVTNDILQVLLRFPPSANFKYLAGQYIDLIYNGVKRSYSIANVKSDQNNELELHIRRVTDGKMSNFLFNDVKENQLMRIEGPKGTFFLRCSDKPIIFIATGTGIAPIKAMLEKLIQECDKRKVYIYWGMRYSNEIYDKRLISLSKDQDNIIFKGALSKEKTSNMLYGYVQDNVCNDFKTLKGYQVYACGSVKMIEAAKNQFLKQGLCESDFFSDAFTAASV